MILSPVTPYIRKVTFAFVGCVLYTFMFSIILYGSFIYRPDHMVFDFVYAFVYFLLLYEGYLRIVSLFNIQFRQTHVNRFQYLKALMVFVLYSLTLLTLVGVIPFLLIMDGFVSPVGAANELRLNYILNGTFAALYFAYLTASRSYNQYQATLVQIEQLQKERARAQLETLKNQISPHFLFNSLNALSSLIYLDEDKATRFVDELARIFRYVIDNRDCELVELKAELEFIKAFFFLLKIRFRESIHLELSVAVNYLGAYLPPLTLQMLIENAIKHNIVSKEEPLTIRILAGDDYLTVRNNLQKREIPGTSTGIGLNNIIRRYRYLTDEKVDIVLTNDEFVVRIPLLSEDA